MRYSLPNYKHYPTHSFENSLYVHPLHVRSRVTVLGSFVCVCVSVTTLVATALVRSPKLRYLRVIYHDFLDFNPWISLKRFVKRYGVICSPWLGITFSVDRRHKCS